MNCFTDTRVGSGGWIKTESHLFKPALTKQGSLWWHNTGDTAMGKKILKKYTPLCGTAHSS